MKFIRNNQGAISIFLLIILLPVMVLSSVLIDGSRKLASDMIFQEAADSAAMSVLADYNGLLKTEFGLFAIQDDSAVEENFKKYLSSTLMANGITDPTYTELAYSYLKGLLVGQSKFKNAEFLNLYNFKIDETKVDPVYSLANPEVLENQIVEYMKYRAPVELVKKGDFLKIVDGVKQIDEVKEASNLLSKKNAYDKQLCKLQALCKEVSELVQGVNNKFNDNYFQQVQNEYLTKISDYIAAINTESEAEARKALEDYRKAVSDYIQKDGIDMCKDTFLSADIIDKAQAILKKIDDVRGQAESLINEMNSKKSEPGMVGEVAAQIVTECEQTLKELNKEKINQLIADTETKRGYLEKFKNAFDAFDYDGYTKDSDLDSVEKDFLDLVINVNKNAGYQIIFENPFKFAGNPVQRDKVANYRDDRNSELDKKITDPTSKPPSIDISAINGFKYDQLPSNLQSLSESELMKELSAVDKEYVGEILQDWAGSTEVPPDNPQDMSKVLESIDFVEKDENLWNKIFSLFSDAINKTAFDVVFGGVSWIFEGVQRFFEDLRDDILVVEYASGTFKSRLTVSELTTPPPPELMEKEYVAKWRYETDKNGQSGEQDLRGRRKLDKPTLFQNAELEYVVAGDSSEEWNKNQVYAYIFSLRLMNNLIAVYTDPARNNACLAAATAILGWTGVGIPILHWSFMLALASAESIIDMNFLIEKGYKIPLIRRKNNFNLSTELSSPTDVGAPNFAAGDIPVCYEDYLKILMIMLVDRKTRVKRIGDLVQMDMYARGKTDFQLQEAYTYIRAEAKSSIDFLFLPVVANKTGTIKNRSIIYQGY